MKIFFIINLEIVIFITAKKMDGGYNVLSQLCSH